MRTNVIEDKVKTVVSPMLGDFGIELVDVVFTSERGKSVLKFFIDKPGGVTLDDCEKVSRELGTALDVEDVVPGAYVLEVSSPGLDRILSREKDFKNAIGKKIHVRTQRPLDGRRNFIAVLEGVVDGKLVLRDSEGRHYEIEISNVDTARLEVVI